MLLAFHKPYGVLSQFTKEAPDHHTLAEFGFPKHVYPIGRLDWDSEGLLLLSNERDWTEWLLNPKNRHERVYHAQVDRVVTPEAIAQLQKGVLIDGEMTRPAKAKILENPGYPERVPPVRFRKTVPTSWLELKLTEGKNRQVRRMTAAVGFPTLRLLRVSIGTIPLGDLAAGKWRELSEKEQLSLR